MSPKKKNGNDVINKLLPMFIDVPSNHPNYMPQYMKLRRTKEKMDPLEIKKLEFSAEKLFEDLKTTINIKKIL